MKKIYIFCSVIIAIIIVLCALSIMLQDYKMSKDIIVIKAEENLIIGVDKGNNDIIIVNSKKQNLSEFEKGQTVIVAYNGIVNSSWPGSITAGKVSLADDSITEVEDYYLRYAYNDISKLKLDISNTNVQEFRFSLTDNNSLKYLFNEEYLILLYKDGEKIIDKEAFKLESENGILQGTYKFESRLLPGKYSGNLIGNDNIANTSIRFEFDVTNDGIINNAKALIEDISGNL